MFEISPKVPVRAKWVIWARFGAKFKQFIISESALRIFLRLCSMSSFYKRKKMICFLFPKKFLFWDNKAIWSHFGPQLRNLISLDPLEGFF